MDAMVVGPIKPWAMLLAKDSAVTPAIVIHQDRLAKHILAKIPLAARFLVSVEVEAGALKAVVHLSSNLVHNPL